ADIVITSDSLPVSMNLYQAAKLLAPAGWLLRPGGVVILCAECPRGTGPLDVVNEGIWKLGIRHFFADPEPTDLLVSSLPKNVVDVTFTRYAENLDDAVAQARAQVRGSPRILVMPRAGDLIPVR